MPKEMVGALTEVQSCAPDVGSRVQRGDRVGVLGARASSEVVVRIQDICWDIQDQDALAASGFSQLDCDLGLSDATC